MKRSKSRAYVTMTLAVTTVLSGCGDSTYEAYAKSVKHDADSVLIAIRDYSREVTDTLAKDNFDDFVATTPPQGLEAPHLEMVMTLTAILSEGSASVDDATEKLFLSARRSVARQLSKKGVELGSWSGEVSSEGVGSAAPPQAIPYPPIDTGTRWVDTTKKAEVASSPTKTRSATGGQAAEPRVSLESASDTDQTYFEFQVESPVSQVSGTGVPRYPDALRSSGVEGEVQAQFVVGREGKADITTLKVLKTTNDLFSSAVRSALPDMRFYAAEVNGKKVKQLVQQSFQFRLDR